MGRPAAVNSKVARQRGKVAFEWLVALLFLFCRLAPATASEKLQGDSGLAAAICPVVYPLDERPSEKGYHYLFYGNAFFINEDGYAITAAHLMRSFSDGGEPHVLVELPTGERRLLKAEVVTADWDHDVALLRVSPNPFRGEYRVRFLPLATERAAQGKAVLSVSLRPSSLENAYTFDTPLQDRSQGEILGYQYTRGDKGQEIELLLYSQKVVPGQSGSPVISRESGEAVGFIEGRWLHPTASPLVEQVDPSPGAAVRIHYAIALLQQRGIPWHATLEQARHAESLEQGEGETKGFSPPSPLSLVAAPYPQQALFGNEVFFDAQVNTKGRITDVRVVRGQSPFLEEVLSAVQTWTFLPARKDGQPVEARIGIVFQFPQPYLPKLTSRAHEYKLSEAGSQDFAALPVYTIEPEYPPDSIGEGSVILHEIVDQEAHVTSIHVLRDLPSLTAPTVAAVKHWRFMPGRREGENVESGVITVVTFRRPVLAGRLFQPDNDPSPCGVSMKGHCLFRQRP